MSRFVGAKARIFWPTKKPVKGHLNGFSRFLKECVYNRQQWPDASTQTATRAQQQLTRLRHPTPSKPAPRLPFAHLGPVRVIPARFAISVPFAESQGAKVNVPAQFRATLR